MPAVRLCAQHARPTSTTPSLAALAPRAPLAAPAPAAPRRARAHLATPRPAPAPAWSALVCASRHMHPVVVRILHGCADVWAYSANTACAGGFFSSAGTTCTGTARAVRMHPLKKFGTHWNNFSSASAVIPHRTPPDPAHPPRPSRIRRVPVWIVQRGHLERLLVLPEQQRQLRQRVHVHLQRRLLDLRLWL